MGRKLLTSTMPFLNRTRTKRNTIVVLLMWVFALASGVANACMLERPGSYSAAPVELFGHSSAVDGHDGGSDFSKAPCLKVCDDGSRTLLAVYASGDRVDSGLAPWFATVWAASPQRTSVDDRRLDAARPIVGLALRVRYARLSL